MYPIEKGQSKEISEGGFSFSETVVWLLKNNFTSCKYKHIKIPTSSYLRKNRTLLSQYSVIIF